MAPPVRGECYPAARRHDRLWLSVGHATLRCVTSTAPAADVERAACKRRTRKAEATVSWSPSGTVRKGEFTPSTVGHRECEQGDTPPGRGEQSSPPGTPREGGHSIGVNQTSEASAQGAFARGVRRGAGSIQGTYAAPWRPGLLFVAAAAGARNRREKLEIERSLAASVRADNTLDEFGARRGRHKQEPGPC